MWNGYKVIDAAGHMHEPQSLWERYVEPKFREQVPKVAFDGWQLHGLRACNWERFFSFAEVHAVIIPVLLHVLPDGFIRIRHFAFYANRWAVGSLFHHL